MIKDKKIDVGIIGATGIVGQRYIDLLESHPWFNVTFLAASERSADKLYADAVSGRWHMPTAIPSRIAKLKVYPAKDIVQAAKSCQLVFSALSGIETSDIEELYASAGLAVVSNTSAHRHTCDVPLIIPEINADHLDIIPAQQKARSWDKGFIIVKPNCSLQSYMTPLYALHKKFQVTKVIVTTLQAVSGAGHPGVSSFDLLGNVIPFISGEEEKSEKEPLKIFGEVTDTEITYNTDITISAHCNRVPVIDGHTACVSVAFANTPTHNEIIKCWETFKAIPQEMNLPMAPEHAIHYHYEIDRPQPRFDKDLDKGMTVSVGRLRNCHVLDYRFVGLSHNTLRGAAGGGILNAELLVAKNLV